MKTDAVKTCLWVGALALGLLWVNTARADQTKANNTTALNVGTSWVSSTAPVSTDIAIWNNTSGTGSGDSPLLLGASTSWKGIKLDGTSGNISGVYIGGATENSGSPYTLTLGSGGIVLTDTATGTPSSLTINANIALGANQTWSRTRVGTGSESITINGTVSGAYTLTVSITGYSSLTFNGDCNVSGVTCITGAVVFGAAFPDANYNIASGAKVSYSPAAGKSYTMSKVISSTDTLGSFNMSGAGTLTLSGANTFSCAANISAGTIVLNKAETAGTSGPLGKNNTIILGGGYLQYTANNQYDYSSRFSTATTQKYYVDTNGQSVTWATALTSSGGTLIKTGTGAVTLSGNNTYTGATTISAGILGLGHATDTLLDTGAVTVSGGELSIAGNSDTVGVVTLTSGSITGTGGTLTGSSYDVRKGSISAKLGGANVTLTKSTSDIVTLTGANTYTGLTTVSDGTLAYGASNVIASGAVTIDGATAILSLGSYSDSVGAVTLKNGGSITGSTGVLTGTSYAVESGSVSAILGGGVALTKSTSGTVTLSGANTYTGGTTVNAGTLALGSSGAVGSSGTISMNGGTMQFSASNTTDYSARLKLEDGKTATFDTNGQTVAFANVLAHGAGGTGALTKTGAGKLTISGSNSYTGATTVNEGTLAVNGSLAGAVTVNSGGTLMGTGVITGSTAIQNGALLSPGNSPGYQKFETGLMLGSTSTTLFELGGTSRSTLVNNGDGYYDAIDITGGIFTLAGMITVSSWNGFTSTASQGDSFQLFNSSVGITTTESGYSFNFDGAPLAAGLSWDTSTFLTNGTITVIPEPGTAGVVATFLAAALLRRRRFG